MPVYTVQAPDGKTYSIEGPAGATAEQLGAVITGQQQPAPAPQAPARLNSIEPPNWIERQLAKLPDLISPKTESQLRGFAMGAADPSVGIAQMAANAIGQGEPVNQAIQQKEQQYQQGRKNAGREGFDATRLAGNVAITAPLSGSSVAPSLLGKIGQGAVTGGAYGLSNPVTEGDYWAEKGKQGAVGAVTGGVASPLASALARVLNPNATQRVAQLKEAGINPTIGQTLGGAFGKMEEKAQSLPIMGDMISAARQNARDQFNRATINKAVSPVGESVSDIGHAGVKEAGDKLSAAYNSALSKLDTVKLDPQFQQDFGQLRQMASNLTPNMAGRFENIVNDNLLSRVSPTGSLTAETLKQAESEINKKAASFGSVGGEQGELGDALKQVVSLLRQQVARQSPEAAQAVRAADEGWANLVRIEGAAKAAKGHEGVFTPGQLLNAVRGADQSVRDRATARGTALMQDWASQGQKVLGDVYPDSGTTGRLMLGAGGLASGAISPLIPASLIGGAGIYTSPVQKLLVGAATNRPEMAKRLAELLRNSNGLAIPAVAGSQALINNR